MNKAIEIKNLHVHFIHEDRGVIHAVNDVNLNVYQGEHIAILGENGSGKSTLLRVIRGEIYPDQRDGGSIYWYDKDVAEKSPLVGRTITSFMSPKIQEYYATQAWNINCLEIILAALSNDYVLYREPREEEIAEATKLAQKLGIEHFLYQNYNILSQGQLRLVLIARTLIRKSPIILLDEICDGLDSDAREVVYAFLEEYVRENKCTFILTSHRLPLPSFIKKIYRMNNGVINGTLSPEVKRLNPVYTERSDNFFAQENPASMEINIENADVYLDHTKILHNINWQIKAHEQWCLIGKNGSGKSTLLKTILGFLPVALGGSISRTLYLNKEAEQGKQGEIVRELAEIKKHIRLVSDALQIHYSYDDSLENIIFAGFDGNIGVYRNPSQKELELVEYYLELTGLVEFRNRSMKHVSTGQARRALIARALIGEPKLALLDEPFSGIDALSRDYITLLLEEKIKHGMQTIIVSHHEQDILPSTKRFARISEGILEVIKA